MISKIINKKQLNTIELQKKNPNCLNQKSNDIKVNNNKFYNPPIIILFKIYRALIRSFACTVLHAIDTR